MRNDSPTQLEGRLDGLRWQWVPYLPSGLPLSRGIEHALCAAPDTNLFVLGNHGLVIGGEDANAVEYLLNEVRIRLGIPLRQVAPPDYSALMEMCSDSPWVLPEDVGVHALGTDAICQAIVARGLLYACQAIFSGSMSYELFRAIRYPDPGERRQGRYNNRPFLIIEGRGALVHRTIAPSDLAMLSGLAKVVQRLNGTEPLRYLTEAEIADIGGQVAYRYRELANSSR